MSYIEFVHVFNKDSVHGIEMCAVSVLVCKYTRVCERACLYVCVCVCVCVCY